jgi:hypothetical protein
LEIATVDSGGRLQPLAFPAVAIAVSELLP